MTVQSKEVEPFGGLSVKLDPNGISPWILTAEMRGQPRDEMCSEVLGSRGVAAS